MTNKDRIINYIAQGYKAEHVASITGFTASYISQVLKEDGVSDKIIALKEEQGAELTEDKILTTKYAGVEHKLLTQIESQMAFAELPALVRALEVVGNRQEKRALRLAPPPAQSGISVNVLNLQLPSHAALQLPGYQLNENKEVISIAGREMAPLTSDGVKNLFDSISGKNATQILEASDF